MTKSTALIAKLTGLLARRPQLTGRKPFHKTRPLVEPLEQRNLLADMHVLTNEHTDLNVFLGQDPNCADPEAKLGLNHVNKSVFPTEYYPTDQTILEFLPGAKRPRTSDPRFNFIGVGAGEPVWIVPISPRDPNLLQLGVSGEQIAPDAIDDYIETDSRVGHIVSVPWIKVNVVEVRGPGYFSVWEIDDSNNPVIWVSTAPDGNPNPNLFFTVPGAHFDYNWAFTAAGDYEVDLQATAFMDDAPIHSCVTTYHFQVADAESAPVRSQAGLEAQKAGFALITGTFSTTAHLESVTLAANSRATGTAPLSAPLVPAVVDQLFAPPMEGRALALPHLAQPSATSTGSQFDSADNLFSASAGIR